MNIKLKTLILEKFRYQADLAKRAGIHETLLSRIVSGRRDPYPDEAQAIAEALDATVEELFG